MHTKGHTYIHTETCPSNELRFKIHMLCTNDLTCFNVAWPRIFLQNHKATTFMPRKERKGLLAAEMQIPSKKSVRDSALSNAPRPVGRRGLTEWGRGRDAVEMSCGKLPDSGHCVCFTACLLAVLLRAQESPDDTGSQGTKRGHMTAPGHTSLQRQGR